VEAAVSFDPAEIARLQRQQERIAREWRAKTDEWNNRECAFNPQGIKFSRKELDLMAQQEGFDRAGISGFEPAATANGLLSRAQAMERVGRQVRR
jgi:hypothetical protein